MTRNANDPRIVSLSLRDIVGATVAAGSIVVATIWQASAIAVRLDRMERAIDELRESHRRIDRQMIFGGGQGQLAPGGNVNR